LEIFINKVSINVKGTSIPIAIIDPGIAYPSDETLLKNKFIFVGLILAE